MPLDQLQKYREKDKRNVEGEVQPENETLNSRYIRDFLRVKMGLETGQPGDEESIKRHLDYFDDHFKLSAAIDLADSKEKDIQHIQTKGEHAIVNLLSKAKAYLDQKGKPDLFEDANPKSALSNLERLTKDNNDYTRRFPELKEAYFTYNMVRQYCRRIFEVERVAIRDRQTQKTEIGGDLQAGFAKKIEEVKGNFGNISGEKKLTVLAAAVIGTALLTTSDSSRMEGWKEGIFNVVKIGFGLYAANILWEVFTGKTAIDSISDWTSSTAGNENFWKKSFHTSPEKAKIVQSSMIYLHDHDFVDLAERYQKAKASNTKKIELASVASKDMTSEQIYIALDVFFSQYGGAGNPDKNAVNLRKRFRNYKPPAKWLEIVSIMLVEDGRLEFKGNLAQRAADNMGAYITSAWNEAAGTAVGAGIGEVASDIGAGAKEVTGTTYGVTKRATKAVWEAGKGTAKTVVSGIEIVAYPIAWFGEWSSKKTAALLDHKPTAKEVKEFQQKRLFNVLPAYFPPDYHKTMEEVIKSRTEDRMLIPEDAKFYLNTVRKGKIDPEHNLKYFNGTDFIYMVVDSNMDPKVMNRDNKTEESVKAIHNGYMQAKGFLSKKENGNFSDEEIETHSQIGFGIYDPVERVYKLFIRMPKRGTENFRRKGILKKSDEGYRSLDESIKRGQE